MLVISRFRKESTVMTSYTSRAQDCANAIKQAQANVATADAQYRKGGSLDKLNAANRALADAHNDLYVADGGTVPDKR
jgi:hypothetical protein